MFSSGEIDHPAYVSLLDDALAQLDGFDAQVAAKLESGKLDVEDAELILVESGSMRTTIEALAGL